MQTATTDLAPTVAVRDVFEAFLDVLPEARAFSATLATRPTARAAVEGDVVWVRLAPASLAAMDAAGDGHGGLRGDGHRVRFGGLRRLGYVLDGTALSRPDASAPDDTGAAARFPDGLLPLFGARWSDRDAGRADGTDGALCVELLLATDEDGPYVRSGTRLAATTAGWRAVFGSSAWVAADVVFAQAMPARARLSIGQLFLSVDEIRALAPGDLLLPDCARFDESGDCRLCLGGVARAYTIAAWSPHRSLSLAPAPEPAVRRQAADGSVDGIELDVVAGHADVRALDLLRPDGLPASLALRHTLPVVTLMRGGRAVATGELVRSDAGLVIELTRVRRIR